MTTATKTATKRAATKKTAEPTKLSKAGKAMRAGIGRGTIIELTNDPWNTGRK